MIIIFHFLKLTQYIDDFRQFIKQPEKSNEKNRHERKFVIERLNSKQVESVLRYHPAAFNEIFQERQVNNIYLDTRSMDAFNDNVVGNSNRTKVRIRWYGETFGEIENPVMELKIKKGLTGTKLSYALLPFNLDNQFTHNVLTSIFERSKMPGWVTETLYGYYPVLLNKYRRKYYLSADKQIRITLDTAMTYYKIAAYNNNFIQYYVDRDTVILEIKYQVELEKIAADISRHLPVRMTKSSKYVNGIELLT